MATATMNFDLELMPPCLSSSPEVEDADSAGDAPSAAAFASTTAGVPNRRWPSGSAKGRALGAVMASASEEDPPQPVLGLKRKKALFADIMPKGDDAFHWLKYGEKLLRDRRTLRHYYRCSSRTETGCNAKKMVDVLVPTGACKWHYREDHNHPPPLHTKPTACTTTPGPHSPVSVSVAASAAAAKPRGQARGMAPAPLGKCLGPSSVDSALSSDVHPQLQGLLAQHLLAAASDNSSMAASASSLATLGRQGGALVATDRAGSPLSSVTTGNRGVPTAALPAQGPSPLGPRRVSQVGPLPQSLSSLGLRAGRSPSPTSAEAASTPQKARLAQHVHAVPPNPVSPGQLASCLASYVSAMSACDPPEHSGACSVGPTGTRLPQLSLEQLLLLQSAVGSGAAARFPLVPVPSKLAARSSASPAPPAPKRQRTRELRQGLIDSLMPHHAVHGEAAETTCAWHVSAGQELPQCLPWAGPLLALEEQTGETLLAHLGDSMLPRAGCGAGPSVPMPWSIPGLPASMLEGESWESLIEHRSAKDSDAVSQDFSGVALGSCGLTKDPPPQKQLQSWEAQEPTTIREEEPVLSCSPLAGCAELGDECKGQQPEDGQGAYSRGLSMGCGPSCTWLALSIPTAQCNCHN